MIIEVKHLDTGRTEQLEVTSYTENSYTIKGKGTMVVSFTPGTVEIKEFNNEKYI